MTLSNWKKSNFFEKEDNEALFTGNKRIKTLQKNIVKYWETTVW